MRHVSARYEARRKAGPMMGGALALGADAASEIVPLPSEPMQNSFLPQSMPACAVTQNFRKLCEHQPQYAHEEATREDRAARLAARS